MNTENKETKLNMMNHAAMKLPNMVWEYEPYYTDERQAPGAVVSAYIKARQEEAERPNTREELRIGGPNSEGANASDAPAGSQRAGGPVTEEAAAKVYESGDMPPNGGAGFSDNPADRDVTEVAQKLTKERKKMSPAIKEIEIAKELAPKRQDARNRDTMPNESESKSDFTVLQSDWIELSPYGDFAHPRGIQRVDRDAAERIVAQFNSFWSKLGRRFAGVPIYIGHPDVPEYANEYTDKKAYGWITELQARGSGLFAKVKWSNQGREFLQNAHYKFYSPYWEAVFVGEKDGKKIYRPTNLLSVGLTNQPNLPVPPLANSKKFGIGDRGSGIETSGRQAERKVNTRKELTEGNEGKEDQSGTRGATTPYREEIRNSDCRLPNEIGEERGGPRKTLNTRKEFTEGNEGKEDGARGATTPYPTEMQSAEFRIQNEKPVQAPAPTYLPLANEILALQTLLKQRDERIQAMHAQFDNARANWGSEQAQFENEISSLRNLVERLENSRIEIVLDHALGEGRIAPAEREFWNAQLRRDFEIRHEELKQRPEVMHMKSVTGELGKAKVDLSNAATRKRILFELLEAKQRLGMKHDEAWFALKEERPDLFAAMEGNS